MKTLLVAFSETTKKCRPSLFIEEIGAREPLMMYFIILF
jgi:hypothetical protein